MLSKGFDIRNIYFRLNPITLLVTTEGTTSDVGK